MSVWVIDDQIAGSVEECLNSKYNSGNFQCLDVLAFHSAEEAINKIRGSEFKLPDVAIIDLNFNDQTDKELLKRTDHLKTEIQKNIVSEHYADSNKEEGKVSKNQLGFWVAVELINASKEICQPPPLIKLFTANPDIQKQLSWAAIPSPFCNKAYIDVDYKGDDKVSSVVQDYQDLLLDVARLRIKKYGVPPRLVDVLFSHYDYVQSMSRCIDKSFEKKNEVLELTNKLCEEHERLSEEDKSKLDYLYDDLASLREIFDINNHIDTYGSSILNISSYEYKELFKELNKALIKFKNIDNSKEIRKVHRYLFEDSDALSVLVPYFPDVAKWIHKGSAPGLTVYSSYRNDIESAINLLSDNHWELCRLLKKVRMGKDENGDNKFICSTKLSAAAHPPNIPSIFEEELNNELLYNISLPLETKKRLGLNTGSLTNLAARLCGQNASGSIVPLNRTGWQQKWDSLNILLLNDTLSSFVCDPLSLLNRQHLTDWDLFFTGTNSILIKLKEEPVFKKSKIDLFLKELDFNKNILLITILIKIEHPLLQPPSGGIISAIDDLHMWGESVWQATVGSIEHFELWSGGIWPIRIASRVGPMTGDTYFFKIDWTIIDYLKARTND